MDIVIERAKTCHLQKIADIEKEIFSTPWSLKNITDTFKNKNNCFFVAKDLESGETVGHICLEAAPTAETRFIEVTGQKELFDLAAHFFRQFPGNHVGTALVVLPIDDDDLHLSAPLSP